MPHHHHHPNSALLRALEDAGATDVRVKQGADATAVEARVPFTPEKGGRGGGSDGSGGSGKADADRVLLLLRDDGVALFSARAEAGRPDPPFCLTKGCISGPRERARMAALRDALGWAALEAAEDGDEAVWTQILLH